MISYKDMTFCSYWGDCKDGDKCHRALTPEVRAASVSFGLPTCQFSEKPECYTECSKPNAKGS